MQESSYRLYNILNEKDTDELLRIWQEDDRETWQPNALDVIEDILYERLGKLPERKRSEDGVEAITDEDLYYNPERMMKIGSSIKTLSWVMLGLPLLEEILKWIQDDPFALTAGGYVLMDDPVFIVLVGLSIAIGKGIIFFTLLQAFSEGLYLLMDVEENTRPRMN